MRLDLHVHTTASDGSRTPLEVVDAAVAGHLDVIAVTDHDTVAGVRSAVEAAGSMPLEVIPAIELSSTWNGRELHILGYFVNVEADALVQHEMRAQARREERIRDMVQRLGDQGIEVDPDSVLEVAGPNRGSVGRPHLARALVLAGHVDTPSDAFDRLIGDAHPAFIPTDLGSPWDALDVIGRAGGIAVWAHPPMDLLEGLLPRFARSGLRGLEVYRPKNPPDLVLRLERAARAHGLLLTGGSDWHGPEGGQELGEFFVSADEVAGLLEAGGL